jgi:class 3 adenylate cyclase
MARALATTRALRSDNPRVAHDLEVRGPDVAGIAVHIASRISALAQPSEILTSRTVVDLTSGSGITYHPRGDHALKGVPGSWQLSAVQTSGSPHTDLMR